MNGMIILFNLILIAYVYLIFSQKMIKSLLALISIYIFLLPLLIFLNFDFIALILLLLYVGAVSVFFLFVLMTTKLDEQPKETETINSYISLILLLTSVILTFMVNFPFQLKMLLGDVFSLSSEFFVHGFSLKPETVTSINSSVSYLVNYFLVDSPLLDHTSNILNLATGVYLHFGLELMVLGLLLFASAIGAMFFTKQK